MSEDKKTTKAPVKKAKAEAPEKVDVSNVSIPTAEEMLEAGVQFGHATKRWNPKMKDFIFGSKQKIHIIDVLQTQTALQEVVEFLANAAAKGNVLFVGTKNQASDIIRKEAVRSGAFFVDQRWAGGLLTNFPVVKQSLNSLNSLEKQFEEGVEGRTKFEISRMKKEWQRLDRLYSGIKQLEGKPVAAVIIDVNFEKGALRECKKLGIPVVALVDTNVDPESVNYPIPSNDDAITVIELMMKVLADAVIAGNKGKGIAHKLQDYSKAEIKIAKVEDTEGDTQVAEIEVSESKPVGKPVVKVPAKKVSKSKGSKGSAGGILERVQKEKEGKKK